jgi:hypothetical protein
VSQDNALCGKKVALKQQLDRNDANFGIWTLKRDGIWMNRHRALDSWLSMIFSENRFTLFRIRL